MIFAFESILKIEDTPHIFFEKEDDVLIIPPYYNDI